MLVFFVIILLLLIKNYNKITNRCQSARTEHYVLLVLVVIMFMLFVHFEFVVLF